MPRLTLNVFVLGALLLTSLTPGRSFHVEAVNTTEGPLQQDPRGRTRTRLRDQWRFKHWDTIQDGVVYDIRPDTGSDGLQVLKPWILPSGNKFIKDIGSRFPVPSEVPDLDVPYTKDDFNDSDWAAVNVPHDWAINGPFYEPNDSAGSTDMGSLPVGGVGWYRRNLLIDRKDLDNKRVFLDIDGAMSYPMVWLNNHLVGGWPYGYNSFQLDLTPYLRNDTDDNLLAIRVENPTEDFSRWYPGAGIYRNVWVTVTNAIHVAHWGTVIATNVSQTTANLDLKVSVENLGDSDRNITLETEVFEYNSDTGASNVKPVAKFPSRTFELRSQHNESIATTTELENPRLWGPPPSQSPNLYVAVTQIIDKDTGDILDKYDTRFGIRSLVFDADNGLVVNGEHVRIQGANMHHDLGALGAAFNVRAARRQLDALREVGVNAIRSAHNPPAPELLQLTDEMGFIVVNEIFDSWMKSKRDCDFHLIFEDWREQDLRALIRRDRNYPSVIMWSYGNEVPEQNGNDEVAAEMARYLRQIVQEEDSSRPSTTSLHTAWAGQELPGVTDVISLNYQGEGKRYGPAYEHITKGDIRPPQYQAFHDTYPEKMIFGSEVAWSLSSRGKFMFPVCPYDSCPVNSSSGGNSKTREISAYELYSAEAGSSPDRVFRTHETYPFVAGGFVWAGWDYLGESYPYSDAARSAYSGIFDMAGFRKERFYQYQAYWRPGVQMAHIVPHWTWPEDRVGKVTPVHVFSSADEAELFLNDTSLGRLVKEPMAHRFRWDNVTYTPGVLRVETYKDGKSWATDTVQTVGDPEALNLKADRMSLKADGEDLIFVTVMVVDKEGNTVPTADNLVKFSIVSGPGEIVATDNGLPTDFTAFPSTQRNVSSGLALCIVRAGDGKSGRTVLRAVSDALKSAEISLEVVRP
ncbi:beta-galactosidase (Eurofung) [Colletotrichum karsti]|uniref:Beta-galactosidase (Eurofung) n=1 Tax=Colletotrichum karsti TaxID=1095194 RepID=A0A9P6I107_9PEZI|nr:beta-galactosidase (Eurofung) [Colletotrichum karsti]KAF9873817.1 beta-galactosidase (Eurofung) [Colletotrichum karsti]